jgi:hypothetical protein
MRLKLKNVTIVFFAKIDLPIHLIAHKGAQVRANKRWGCNCSSTATSFSFRGVDASICTEFIVLLAVQEDDLEQTRMVVSAITVPSCID